MIYFRSCEGNKEEARRWVLRVRYATGREVAIPLQVMKTLKKIEGRLRKAPRRVPMKRRNNDGNTPAAARVTANADDEEVIRWLLRDHENKIRRMSPDMRKLKMEYKMKGNRL